MTRYRLDARRFSGPLCAPTRNESEAHDCDDWDTVRETARALVARGFTVWIYERVPRDAPPVSVDRRPPTAVDLRLLDQRAPAPITGAPDVPDVPDVSRSARPGRAPGDPTMRATHEGATSGP